MRCFVVLLSLLAIGIFCVVGGIYFAGWHIKRTAAPFHSDQVSDVPKARCAVILGCIETLPHGRTNLYFTYRIQTAAKLFHSGKVEYLIVSGDNGRQNYNEPAMMRAALRRLDIPDERIVSDFAGFSTLDSMVRAKRVFGQQSIIVVSQQFHNERAIYIARHEGLTAYGLNAPDVSGAGGLRTKAREKLARVKTLLDLHLFKTKPKFLGQPVPLAATSAD